MSRARDLADGTFSGDLSADSILVGTTSSYRDAAFVATDSWKLYRWISPAQCQWIYTQYHMQHLQSGVPHATR